MVLKWMQLRALLAAEGVDGGGSGDGAAAGAGDGGDTGGAAGAGDSGAGSAAAAGAEGFKVAVDGAVPAAKPAEGGDAEKPKEGETGADKDVKDGEGDKEGDEKKPDAFPHKPEDYTFTLPDGAPADEAQAAEFAAFAVENKVPPDIAQKLVDFYGKTLQEKIVQPWVDQVNAWAEETKNDKEYGGLGYDENIGVANRALAEFGTPELGEAARAYGWGNHPEWVRAWVKIGKAMGITRTEKPGESGNPGSAIPLKDALYSS